MDEIDAMLLEAHCNIIIKKGLKELEDQRLAEIMDQMFDNDFEIEGE